MTSSKVCSGRETDPGSLDYFVESTFLRYTVVREAQGPGKSGLMREAR